MRIVKLFSIPAIYFLSSSLVVAQESKPAVNPSVETKPSVTEPAQTTDKADHKKPKSTMSLANYKALIASKIAAKARGKNPAGAGEVQATFRVNEEGKIDQIQIKKSTNAALATHVKNILSGIQAAPPPEGAIFLGQSFKFN